MSKATVMAHWPGKTVPACDEHALKITRLGVAMGMRVTLTPCEAEQECTNCENEARKPVRQ